MSEELDAARAGDEAAFAALMAAHRLELHLHCYRMMGSVSDADDALQETMIAAWRGLPDFAGESSLRTWLYRIATRRCLNAIRDAGRRPPVAPVPPFDPPSPTRHADVTWLEPYPTPWLGDDLDADPSERYLAREAIELAFVTSLQRMPPRQTAIVVLCDVLDFSTAEAADVLGVTQVAAKGLLQRGRAALSRERLRDGAGADSVRRSADERDVARRFADAFAADDVEAVVGLLTDDAWLAMPPAPHVYDGPDAIAGFLRVSAQWRAGRHFDATPTRMNGQPAFTCTLDGGAAGAVVLHLRAGRLRGVTRFVT